MSNWYDQTPCRDLWFIFDIDPELSRGVSAEDRRLADLAMDTCRICPVKAECLEDALQYREQEGIRAGLTPSQRAKLVPSHIKSWADRQTEARQSRRAELEARAKTHGFNSVAWQNGCNCGECSLRSTAERAKRVEAERRLRRAKQKK